MSLSTAHILLSLCIKFENLNLYSILKPTKRLRGVFGELTRELTCDLPPWGMTCARWRCRTSTMVDLLTTMRTKDLDRLNQTARIFYSVSTLCNKEHFQYILRIQLYLGKIEGAT